MSTPHVGANIDRARTRAGLSQRELADQTNISQSTLSRIISGDRTAKMPEIIAIAEVTDHTIAQLTGVSDVSQRVRYAARSTNGSGMEAMRETLIRFIELNDYLEDQAIPVQR